MNMSREVKYFFFPKYRPEAMGAVTGCIFLIALFLFIPVPFIPVPLKWNLIAANQSTEFLNNQVSIIDRQLYVDVLF